MLGILLALKPKGISSHDAVNEVRRRFGTRRVGHAGTLDPLATGLLVMAVGPATRFLQYLPLEPKEYVGEFVFGSATDTYDAEGEVVERREVPADLREAIEGAKPGFMGLQSQLPPMHSAVKVKGKPLYAYARKGQELEREPRTVHIDAFDLESVEENCARIRIVCSGGTYIRSLAHDLGQAIGCGAHLGGLQRTRVGRFGVEEATALESVQPSDLVPLAEALPPMSLVRVTDIQVRHIQEGRHIIVEDEPCGTLCALVSPNGNVFSVARVNGNVLQPECVIPAEAFDEAL
ncbi:MAG TPA: tRNA pseudouridine(55) synthase TruB [Fimbriimonas sp.]